MKLLLLNELLKTIRQGALSRSSGDNPHNGYYNTDSFKLETEIR